MSNYTTPLGLEEGVDMGLRKAEVVEEMDTAQADADVGRRGYPSLGELGWGVDDGEGERR